MCVGGLALACLAVSGRIRRWLLLLPQLVRGVCGGQVGQQAAGCTSCVSSSGGGSPAPCTATSARLCSSAEERAAYST
jgi:hypothetical protein